MLYFIDFPNKIKKPKISKDCQMQRYVCLVFAFALFLDLSNIKLELWLVGFFRRSVLAVFVLLPLDFLRHLNDVQICLHELNFFSEFLN